MFTFQVEHDDGVCELIIDSSTRHDAGGYRCVAENSYGSARTTCDVIVIREFFPYFPLKFNQFQLKNESPEILEQPWLREKPPVLRFP